MKKTILSLGIVSAMLVASFFVIRNANAMLTRTLDIGSTGSDVSELQTYYSQDASLYPSGLVTGYFGNLTAGGTRRFQTVQGIVSAGTPATTGYGRVGPRTLARLNALMGGVPTPTTWDSVPFLSVPTVQYSGTSVTIAWSTNEATQGQVFYSTSPLSFTEVSGERQQPYISGTLVSDAGSQTNHTITIPSLQANTTYYFMVRATDSVGNVSVTWPTTFHINP